ncbi:hypothetical protein ACFYZ5_27670 [Streptomyces chartreusis]|uniref:hypothetical protein n=1 Tax=Streptomyces chartreusis TaxID=1969 RepID=UPI00369B484E
MDAPLFGASALLIALATTIYLAYAPHRPQQEPFHMARRARVALFAGAFTSTFLLLPSVAAAVDRLTGRDGMSAFLFSLAHTLIALSLQLVIVNWTHPTERIRRAVLGRICLVCIATVVLAWEFHYTRATSAELASVSPDSSEAATYMLTHLGFLGAISIAICLQYAVLARATWPHHRVVAVGLAVTALGAAGAVAYAATRIGAVIAYRAGSAWPPGVEAHIVPAAGALAAFLVTLGLALPAIAQRIMLLSPGSRPGAGRDVKDRAIRQVALP